MTHRADATEHGFLPAPGARGVASLPSLSSAVSGGLALGGGRGSGSQAGAGVHSVEC